jgi:hypothetical protein
METSMRIDDTEGLKMSIESLPNITLFFQDGVSDKVYKTWIEKSEGVGFYSVKFAYGRRGANLTKGEKIQSSLGHAKQVYFKIVMDKKTKGYKENLTEAYSPLNESAASPSQIKKLKSFVPVVPPGLTSKQAEFMLEQYNKEKIYREKLKDAAENKRFKIPIIISKEDLQVTVGQTGRRIKEID